MSEKDIQEIIDSNKSLGDGLNDLLECIKNPSKYFEDHPIDETWTNPPNAPDKASIDYALSNKSSLKDKINMYSILSKLNHFQKRASKESPNFEYANKPDHWRKLEVLITKPLVNAGYFVRNQSNIDEWNNNKSKKPEIHFMFGLCIDSIPRIQDSNLDISEYILTSNHEVKPYSQLIKEYQAKNAPKTQGLNELITELSPIQRRMFKQFLESESIKPEDVKEVKQSTYEPEILEIDCFNQSYAMVRSIKKAEKIAWNQLNDDHEQMYFFKQYLEEHPDYEGGLKDYKKLVFNDGFEYLLCRYDFKYHETKSNFIYWRDN